MAKKNKVVIHTLLEYIDEFFDGNQAAFAREIGVARQQITQWINAEYIVIGDWIYSPRRELF